MTARVANPSLRWLASYLAAAVSGVALAIFAALTVMGPDETLVWPSAWATKLLLFVIGILFLPLAAGTFILHKTGFWNLAGFAVMGAIIPALFMAWLGMVATAGGRGDAFGTMTLLLILSGAFGGAAFYGTWKLLS